MNDILHANIFFFISSVSTILIAILVGVILFYIARIMRDISDIVRKINNVSDDLERDFQDLRHEIKNEGVKVRSIIDVALGFFLSRVQKRATRKPKPATPPEHIEDVQ
ncbi:hypothetical protein K2Q00_01400 [Patescibacteria group bacterium]|nr:hypothetical protein [Patescibacteria group bacterium]